MSYRKFGIALLSSLFALPSSPGRLCADPIADNQARFGKLTGTVFVLTQGAKEWIDAHEDLPINPGDRIYTEEQSTAEIVLSQNVFLWMRPETGITMDYVQMNDGSLHLEEGLLLGRVDASRADAVQNWKFNTPTAVVAIQGAEFVMECDANRETHVGVIAGQLEVHPAEGPEGLPPPLEVGAKQEAVIPRGKGARVLPQYLPRMKMLARWASTVRQHHLRVQNTYSPFTTTYRQELRSKFVAAVPPARAKPAHKMKLRGELTKPKKKESR